MVIKHWYKNNQRHRVDGAAVEYDDYDKEYWYEDKKYPNIKLDEEWFNFIKLKFIW